ncbi:DUF4194 domain-containing protein [Solicola gregarius]|uniref:DUF4194 domain-containing protein n=1 Tax=Solicola gregarius TaxID=2908642 RepID=A0AA46YM57_9ACTN|nr:DUF4194 domain-containing protein [Solicola gregarius]UYM05473.1 DUF4194 domain-containing protein [Solicola gregarius]
MATTIIELMRGVVYRETHESGWETLDRHGAAVRDHFATLGVDVVVDDTAGYAYLKSQPEDDGEEPLPRLVRRRALTHSQSLLLVLLRKRLVEFDTVAIDGKLVLSRDQIVDELRTFLPESSHEARMIDKVDTTIKQVADIGFLRPLQGSSDQWEVRRVLKAYVDAETLGDYAAKLEEYAAGLRGDADE